MNQESSRSRLSIGVPAKSESDLCCEICLAGGFGVQNGKHFPSVWRSKFHLNLQPVLGAWKEPALGGFRATPRNFYFSRSGVKTDKSWPVGASRRSLSASFQLLIDIFTSICLACHFIDYHCLFQHAGGSADDGAPPRRWTFCLLR